MLRVTVAGARPVLKGAATKVAVDLVSYIDLGPLFVRPVEHPHLVVEIPRGWSGAHIELTYSVHGAIVDTPHSEQFWWWLEEVQPLLLRCLHVPHPSITAQEFHDGHHQDPHQGIPHSEEAGGEEASALVDVG